MYANDPIHMMNQRVFSGLSSYGIEKSTDETIINLWFQQIYSSYGAYIVLQLCIKACNNHGER